MQTGVSYAKLVMESTERFVSLRQMLGISSFGMNLIHLHPGARGRIHMHERQEEVYLVLEGKLTLSVEGVERDLAQGELARVAPEVRRQLVNRGPKRCVLLALGAAGEHLGRDGVAFAGWDAKQGAPPQETPLPEDLPADQLRS